MSIYRLRYGAIAVYQVGTYGADIERNTNIDLQHSRIGLYRSTGRVLDILEDASVIGQRLYAVVGGVTIAKSW